MSARKGPQLDQPNCEAEEPEKDPVISLIPVLNLVGNSHTSANSGEKKEMTPPNDKPFAHDDMRAHQKYLISESMI
jgi:hypothetical protein